MYENASLGGNTTETRTLNVLQKIESYIEKVCNIHKNVLQDLNTLQYVYKGTVPWGGICFLNVIPFTMYFSDAQLKMFCDNSKKHGSSLIWCYNVHAMWSEKFFNTKRFSGTCTHRLSQLQRCRTMTIMAMRSVTFWTGSSLLWKRFLQTLYLVD